MGEGGLEEKSELIFFEFFLSFFVFSFRFFLFAHPEAAPVALPALALPDATPSFIAPFVLVGLPAAAEAPPPSLETRFSALLDRRRPVVSLATTPRAPGSANAVAAAAATKKAAASVASFHEQRVMFLVGSFLVVCLFSRWFVGLVGG
jgi:hypothetical protein